MSSYNDLGYNDNLTIPTETNALYSDNGISSTYDQLYTPDNNQYTTFEGMEGSVAAGAIGGSLISKNAIKADQIYVGNRPFTHNIPFNTSVQDIISWSGGTITWADMSNIAILPGSIGPLYINTAVFPSSGLLLAHLDETTGTAVTDSSPIANNGSGKNDYQYTRPVTITNNMGQTASLTNFPFYLTITDIALKSVANGGHVQSSSGYDIFFTDASGQRIYHEIDLYDAVNGTLNVWVNLASVPAAGTQTITMCYGKLGISLTGEKKTKVWDTNFNMVTHFRSDASDSTGNNYSPTVTGATLTTGKLGQAYSFNGTSSTISYPASAGITGNNIFTFSAWIKPTTHDTVSRAICSMGLGGTTNNISAFKLVKTGTVYQIVHYFWGNDQLFTTTDLSGAWHHVAVSYDGTNVTMYVDGVSLGSIASTGTPNVASANVYVGWANYSGSTEYWNGLIDDFRVSTNVRSADWIKASFNNQNTPSAYVSLGSEVSDTLFLRTSQSRFGSCSRFFDGSDDIITFGSNAAYTFANVQIEASIYVIDSDNFGVITSKNNASTGIYSFYLLSGSRTTPSTASKGIGFGYKDVSGIVHEYWVDNVLTINTWFDIKAQFTFGSPSSVKIFINNILYNGIWRLGTGLGAVNTTASGITIGAFSDNSISFNGWIDEVRIKNTLDAIAMPSPYYIYYNNSQTLSYSASPSDAVGDSKKLLAIWYPKNTKGSSSISVQGGSGTTIDGDSISTGVIRGTNGRSYWDIINNKFVINDGSNDRIVIGYLP